ncbi:MULTISPECIES: class I adenylate-forming enzyme family protein [unclassified Micromonospora]|uniref:class I adenylate-forming enzyme family protein n=1 Tax=unclassified Micromonospora TaxID=2617518 RepID=UPI003A8A8478
MTAPSLVTPAQAVSATTALLHGTLDTAASVTRTAVVDSAGAWTYKELQDASRAAAAWLAGKDVGRGDRVVVKATADRRVVALLYGCSRLGAVIVPVAKTLTPFQLAQIVGDAEPKLVVGFPELDLCGRTLDMVWAEVGACAAAPDGGSAPDPADPLVLFYTSGSTAAPKAVIAPHRQIAFAAAAIQDRLLYRADDTVFCRLPLNFDYGLFQVFLSVLTGAAVVLAGPDDDTRLAVEIERHGATVVPVVPALASMLVRLLRRSGPNRTVRLLTNTGEDLPRATIEQLKQVLPAASVQLMFGLTECKRVAILEPDGYLGRPGSVGRPLAGTSVRIVNPDGRETKPGHSGEIVVLGPHVMPGYWRAPELTRQRFFTDPVTGQAALRTGDMGYLDRDGYLYFQGRRDQLFKHRGVRTSVVEIEAALAAVPGVDEAVVVPPRNGGPLVLYAVSKLTGPELLGELRGLVGPQKLPDVCYVVESLPRGPNGKPDRASLARRTAAGERP